jgi:ParB-like chromosome segregation protein Spo0J
MNIESVKISAVKSNPNNPRVIKDDKFDKLVQSIKDFPEMLKIRPIVVNDDMIVLGGNMRLKACKEAGLKEVPIIKASDLTEEQQREFIIKDNVGFGEFDWEQLKEWDGEELEAWGLDVPTFMIDDSINDIDEVDEFTESVNFVIKCESIEQLEQLQTKLNTSSKKLAYDEFLIKVGL